MRKTGGDNPTSSSNPIELQAIQHINQPTPTEKTATQSVIAQVKNQLKTRGTIPPEIGNGRHFFNNRGIGRTPHGPESIALFGIFTQTSRQAPSVNTAYTGKTLGQDCFTRVAEAISSKITKILTGYDVPVPYEITDRILGEKRLGDQEKESLNKILAETKINTMDTSTALPSMEKIIGLTLNQEEPYQPGLADALLAPQSNAEDFSVEFEKYFPLQQADNSDGREDLREKLLSLANPSLLNPLPFERSNFMLKAIASVSKGDPNTALQILKHIEGRTETNLVNDDAINQATNQLMGYLSSPGIGQETLEALLEQSDTHPIGRLLKHRTTVSNHIADLKEIKYFQEVLKKHGNSIESQTAEAIAARINELKQASESKPILEEAQKDFEHLVSLKKAYMDAVFVRHLAQQHPDVTASATARAAADERIAHLEQLSSQITEQTPPKDLQLNTLTPEESAAFQAFRYRLAQNPEQFAATKKMLWRLGSSYIDRAIHQKTSNVLKRAFYEISGFKSTPFRSLMEGTHGAHLQREDHTQDNCMKNKAACIKTFVQMSTAAVPGRNRTPSQKADYGLAFLLGELSTGEITVPHEGRVLKLSIDQLPLGQVNAARSRQVYEAMHNPDEEGNAFAIHEETSLADLACAIAAHADDNNSPERWEAHTAQFAQRLERLLDNNGCITMSSLEKMRKNISISGENEDRQVFEELSRTFDKHKRLVAKWSSANYKPEKTVEGLIELVAKDMPFGRIRNYDYRTSGSGVQFEPTAAIKLATDAATGGASRGLLVLSPVVKFGYTKYTESRFDPLAPGVTNYYGKGRKSTGTLGLSSSGTDSEQAQEKNFAMGQLSLTGTKSISRGAGVAINARNLPNADYDGLRAGSAPGTQYGPEVLSKFYLETLFAPRLAKGNPVEDQAEQDQILKALESPDSMWQFVAARIDANPEFRDTVSIGWQENKAYSAVANFNASIGARFSMDETSQDGTKQKWSLGLFAGGSATHNIGRQNVFQEISVGTGTISAAKTIITRSTRIESTITLGAGVALDNINKGTPPASKNATRLGGNIPLPGINARKIHSDQGVKLQSRVVDQEGKINHAGCVTSEFFKSKEEFIEAINQERTAWEAALGKDQLEEFIKSYISPENDGPYMDMTFVKRTMLTPEAAAKISALRTEREFLASGNKSKANAAIQQIVDDPRNYQPYGLSVSRNTDEKKSWSLFGIPSMLTIGKKEESTTNQELVQGQSKYLADLRLMLISKNILARPNNRHNTDF